MNIGYRKRKEAIHLAVSIENSPDSFEMQPCSSCTTLGRKYVFDRSKADRCSECKSIAFQKRKLQLEKEEAMAKILRLRKQQRILEQREHEMAKRGLRFLDKLDAVEEKERKEAEERERATAATPSTVGFREVDLSALDDAFVLDFGET
ncbi:hypothetical protein EG329_008671 [Mollisiaceae sp. DMI_Dod_QoI]|nr:hypothetical protein EG329_008671 [Helotiales sp. DMI_Dod_QoI]